MFGDIVAEFVQRTQAGERVNREALLSRFPNHAKELGEFLRNWDAMDALLGRPDGAPVENGAGQAPVDLAGDSCTNAEARNGQGHEGPLAAFAIVEALHRGAQGVVYRAVQRSTGRVAALKVQYGRAAPSFESEVRLIAGLRHPNVVTIYDAGLIQGRPYCAMEFVDGVPLDHFLSKRALDTPAKLRLFMKICAGVMHAHQHCVIHRDLKPSNILVESNGEPRVLDFDLATRVAADVEKAGAVPEPVGEFVGTLAYASPEQIAGREENIDTRSDVYALGVILYEMLVGQRPYTVPQDRRSALEVIAAADPPRPSAKRGALHDDIDCIVRKAIAMDAADRYPSVESLVTEIIQYLTKRPIEQKRDRLGYVVGRFVSRRRRSLAIFVVGAFMLAVLSARIALLIMQERATANALSEEKEALAVERAVAGATAFARYKAARLADLRMMQKYQASIASAARLGEIAQLPPDRIEAHMARYKSPLMESGGVFATLVEEMPGNLIDAIRNGDGPEYEAGTRWLVEMAEQLDSLAVRLESACFEFSVGATSYRALGWDYVPVREAARTCEAFVARAYLRHAAKNHRGAIADAGAATRLAADIGDGVLCEHKMCCYHCQSQILGFLQFALTEAIETNEGVDLYVEQALTYPPMPAASTSLTPTRLGMHELLHLAMRAESNHGDELIDLVWLDELLGNYLKGKGALTDANIKRLADSEPRNFILLMDRYISCAEAWDDLTAFEIRDEMVALSETLLRERETNPLLWYYTMPGNEFLMRLRTCSQRQALRLVASASRYRAEHGWWPERLADALTAESAGEITDPRTGLAFVYDVAADLPRIRSVYTDDLRGRLGHLGTAWAAEGDDLVTYFPSGAR
jgi:predicted Ser/Thr protein kinase